MPRAQHPHSKFFFSLKPLKNLRCEKCNQITILFSIERKFFDPTENEAIFWWGWIKLNRGVFLLAVGYIMRKITTCEYQTVVFVLKMGEFMFENRMFLGLREWKPIVKKFQTSRLLESTLKSTKTSWLFFYNSLFKVWFLNTFELGYS